MRWTRGACSGARGEPRSPWYRGLGRGLVATLEGGRAGFAASRRSLCTCTRFGPGHDRGVITPTIMSTVLALAPPTDLAPPDFSAHLDSVEFIDGGEDIQLVARDANGEVIGSIALWVDERGRIHVLSDYPDGYAETVIDSESVLIDATLSPTAVMGRAAQFGERLYRDWGQDPQEGVGSCAFSVVATAGSCVAATILCPISAIPLACNCVPLIVPEWTKKKCPYFD
jgi:hypothetical protein